LRDGSFVVVLDLERSGISINSYPVVIVAHLTSEEIDFYSNPRWPAGEISVTAYPAGGYTLTWAAYEEDYDDGETWVYYTGSFTQRFDDAGTALGPPSALPWTPNAITAGRGGFVAVRTWSERPYANPTRIRAYRFSPTGQRLSAATATLSTAGSPEKPVVASAPSGRFVVVWRRSTPASDGIYARLFTPDGTPHGPEIRVDVHHEGLPDAPAVAMAPDGSFVVVWQAAHDGDRNGVFARAFDVTGKPQTGEIQVSSDPVGDQIAPSLAVQKDGRFLVAWQSSLDAANPWRQDGKVWAQYFAPDGHRIGSAFLLDPEEALPQLTPIISTTPEGRYAAVWYRNGNESHHGNILVGRTLGERQVP
jgi:hypothetical protein